MPKGTHTTPDQNPTPGRFSVSRNHLGVTSIVDATKKEGKARGVIAIFFQDEQYPTRAEMYAKVCAAALNQEAARRAQKD